jgi:spermidine synthase
LVASGRYLPTERNQANVLYIGEGMNAMVAVTELEDGVRNFHISGKVEASSEKQDMRLQRMLGHIPALLHPKPHSVLVVGFGAGVTAGSFVLHPDVERIVICEIEPLIPKVVAHYFAQENYNVLNDGRVEVIYDDARHYILTTQEKFDIITSDPIHPWVKGSATLYTREYFELCKQHLKAGGLITQWVPLYESTAEIVKSEIATFFEAFPDGIIWSNDIDGKGYDIVLLGQANMMKPFKGSEVNGFFISNNIKTSNGLKIDVDALVQRLNHPNYSAVAQSLDEVSFRSAIDLLATYAGRGPDLMPWLKDAEINRDRNLRLQYLAGMGLNSYQGEQIYDEMLVYCRFTEELFTGSDQAKQALRKAYQTKLRIND